jgi:hypothetical protein
MRAWDATGNSGTSAFASRHPSARSADDAAVGAVVTDHAASHRKRQCETPTSWCSNGSTRCEPRNTATDKLESVAAVVEAASA